jgi:SAM-dependent methyltransferase
MQTMRATDNDARFAGAIPQLYEQLLVPMLFEPYAVDIAERVAGRAPDRVLELAAGTGVVTRELAARLPATTAIVATDLNPPMLDMAVARGTARPVEWRQADAMALPFVDASFDLVLCQFGVMFFPDKAKAFAEARRVLAPGGLLLFNVWDRIEDNEFPMIATTALATVFPDAPPRFLARVPHGYHEATRIRRDLADGGFTGSPGISTVAARSRADSAWMAAVAFCQGTPLRGEIESRDPAALQRATDVVAAALARRFGDGAVQGRIQAHVVCVER